jgi:2-phosphosulfolactate phosphatase
VSNPHGQNAYQVRFDWGAVGAEAIADGAHVVVWVDQLAAVGRSSGGSGEPMPLLGGTPGGVELMPATLEEAADVANFCLRRQTELGGRFVIAVAAAGAARADGSVRFAVEDLLAAGAIVEALDRVGIDHQSPEAAAAASAYSGLKNATRHLISASASSREARESSEA